MSDTLDPRALEAAALLEVIAEDAQRRDDTTTWSMASVMAERLRAPPASLQPANPAQVADAQAVLEAHFERPLKEWEITALRAALTAAIGAGGQVVAVKPLDDDQIMEIIREVAPWKTEPQLNDLLTYEKSPPLFPQATYDVPSYRAANFVRAVERRILSALSQPHPADERVASTKSAARGARQLYEYWSKQAGQNDLAMHLKELADIEEMLDGGQGDDDGAQTMPDFEPGWSVLAKVEACLFLLEKRRDVIEAYGDERLFRADVHMADGEIKMTAAEEVLAHLLINVIGVVDDQNYTPNEAQEIIERRLSHPADERVVEALAEIQAIAMLAEGNATLSAIGRIARAALSAAPATATGGR